MAVNKTKPESVDPAAFIAAVPNEKKRADARTLAAMMERLSGEPPVMWGPSIVGFGSYHYRYDSGREGDAARIGFSPRSTALVLYLADGFPHHADLLSRLGKHKTGKSCLYVNTLSDVDGGVLEELITASVAWMDETYPPG